MAGVQQRPNAFFRITPADAANARTFAVRRGDIIRRLDPRFNHPRYGILDKGLDSAQIATPELGELLKSISSGATPHRSDASLYADSGIKFLRILNIDDGEIIERDMKHITADVHQDALNRSRLAANDVLMTITGRVGSAAVVRESLLPANINQHIVRMRIDAKRCLPDFLSEWLNCPAGLELSNRGVSGGTRPALDYSAIRDIRIPLPASLGTQDGLVQDMNTARAARKAMLDEADTLLAGIDAFVLSALEINPTPPQATVFTTRYEAVKGSRFDPDFHSLRFRTIRNALDSGLHPTKSVGELCEYIRTGFAAGRQDQAFDYETGVPHIRPLNLDVLGQVSLDGTKFVPKTSVSNDKWCVRGEVLFNNTNSTGLVGKSAVFDLKQPCACSNHITRLKPYDGVEPEFLASTLNALRRLGYLGLLSTNFNNQAGVNVATLSQVRIPVPPLEEQGRIVAEIIERRNKARRMRSEAEVILRDAKQRFEAQLLGGIENC